MPEKETAKTVWLLIVLLCFISYGNQLIYRYSVPPGYDPLAHQSVVTDILHGHYRVIIHTHSVWHIIVAVLSQILHLDGLTVMAWLGPGLIVLMCATLFYFNKAYFGFVAGLTSLILMGFFSLQPLQTLNDGGFPNVLAAGTVLPLFLMTLENLLQHKPKLSNFILCFLAFILLFYTHHLTTLYTLAILFFYSLLLAVRVSVRKRIPLILILALISLFIGGGILLLWGFLHGPIGGSAKALAKLFINVNGKFPFVHFIGQADGPNAIWPWRIYAANTGLDIILLGGVGFLIALARVLTQPGHPHWRIYVLLVIWTLMLLIGSRIPNLGDPVRLARDMAIPLALLAGIFIQELYTLFQKERLPLVLFYIVIAACFFNGYAAFYQRLQMLFLPNPLIHHLPVDTVAADYIASHLSPSAHIIAFQDDLYLQYFVHPQVVTWDANDQDINKIVTYTHPYDLLKNYNYLYLEERYNSPSNFTNNPTITKNYLKSPFSQLIFSASQPEKKVYLFKIMPVSNQESGRSG